MNSTTPVRHTVLGIETSTVCCSVALSVDGVITHLSQEIPRSHNQAVLGMVSELLQVQSLKVSDLNAICFGQGPGSFTGTRIAAAVTQGLALPFATPVYAVSSLHALAATALLQAPQAKSILSFIRSRPGEYYRGSFHVQETLLKQKIQQSICSSTTLFVGCGIEDRDANASDWIVVFDELAFTSDITTLQHSDQGITIDVMRPTAPGLLAVPECARVRVQIDQVAPIYLQGSKPWKKTAKL